MNNKEEMLKEIEASACNYAAAMWYYCNHSIYDTAGCENINKAANFHEQKLKMKCKEFLKEFPEVSEKELKNFVQNIQMCERIIVQAAKKIESYQDKKNELLKNFLEN